ncbi:MAG TPA: PqqD family protein [Kiritimatiellia bacterium]|nr:PqqD family protein [Kiritimatiellia bacterium]
MRSVGSSFKTYRVKGRVVLRHIGTDRLLVPVAGEAARSLCVFPVNETGAFFWERLERGVPVSKVGEDVAARFEVDEDSACKDVEAFAVLCCEQGLLEEVDG